MTFAGAIIGLLIGWLIGAVSWVYAAGRSRRLISDMPLGAEMTRGNRWDRMSLWLAIWGAFGIAFGAAAGAAEGVAPLVPQRFSESVASWSWGGALGGTVVGFVVWLIVRGLTRRHDPRMLPATKSPARRPVSQPGTAAAPAGNDSDLPGLAAPDPMVLPHVLSNRGKERSVGRRMLGLMVMVFLLFVGSVSLLDWLWWTPLMKRWAAQQNALRIYAVGVDRYQAGDLDAARELFTQTLEVDPQFALAYQNRGQVHLEQGNWKEAMDDCTRAIELDPRQADSYKLRGLARLYQGFDDEAEKDFAQYREMQLDYKIRDLEEDIRIVKEQRTKKP